MTDKIYFLQHRLIPLLRTISFDTPPAWGKMTLQQMIEHFSDYVRIASGRSVHQLILTPEEQLPRMHDFIRSDKTFKENTKNSLMPEVPAPVINKNISAAIEELQKELTHFFDVFEANEHLTTRNPFFGDLNFELNVHLLYKHAMHHLRQFGVIINNQTTQ